jgi:4-hydroxy-2-oxoheptanedioate aldolase
MSAVSLRARALAGDRLLGVLVRMPSEELVEMAAVAGYDFVLVDCEHGPADVVPLRQHIAAARIYGVPVIVRTGSHDSQLILRALDQGAEGILAPHLDSVADAETLVAASHYPPLGVRGFAAYGRAGRFGEVTAAAHRESFLANTLVLGMIESPAGVAAAADIAAVNGLDGIMLGPADLAATSGPEDLSLDAATSAVGDALVRAGKLRMVIVSGSSAASSAFDGGAQMVVYNLAAALMTHLRALAIRRDRPEDG